MGIVSTQDGVQGALVEHRAEGLVRDLVPHIPVLAQTRPCLSSTNSAQPLAQATKGTRHNAQRSDLRLVQAQGPNNKSCNSALRKSGKRMRQSSNACPSALQAAAGGAPAVSHSVAQPTHALVLVAHPFYGDC